MTQARTIDITALMDARPLSGFNIRVVALTWLMMIVDGFDFSNIAVAGPFIVKSWGVISAASLGYVFSAVLAGSILGTPIFGWIGDRYGRKPGIILALLCIGVCTFATTFATSLDELFILRFLTGAGFGGLTPNTLTLNAEFAPKRMRATAMIVMFTGITFGSAIPGLVAPKLIPIYGWQVLFFVGGAMPLIMAVVAVFFLPESIKFLVVRNKSITHIDAILRQLNVTIASEVEAPIFVVDEKVHRNFSPKLLFANRMAYLTVPLWIAYALASAAHFFVLTWLPTIIARTPFAHDAPLFLSLLSFGGMLGGLAVARPVDKIGLGPLFVLFLLATPFAAAIGYATGTGSEWLAMVDVFFAGFFAVGLQFALSAASALIYPTSFRANGAAWASTIARVGSVAGPMSAGFLIGTGMSIQTLYLTLAIPLGLGAVCSFLFARFYYLRFHGYGFDQEQLKSAD
jgi:AAHS family 4-hydroxybenzoate transporter-like MFS transporter